MATITLPKSVKLYSDGVSKSLNDRVAAFQANTVVPDLQVAQGPLSSPGIYQTVSSLQNNQVDQALALTYKVDSNNPIFTGDVSFLSATSVRAPTVNTSSNGTSVATTNFVSNKILSQLATVGQVVPPLYIDTANARIGIGQATPGVTLDVIGALRTSGAANVNSLSVVGSGSVGVGLTVGTSLNVGTTLGVSGITTLSNAVNIAGHTMAGPIAGSTTAGNQTSLEIRNNSGTGDSDVAAMSYHCGGSYGIHQHLRADGYFGVGGWSATSWRWYVNMTNGDMTAAGNVTAYSDPRLKEDIKPIKSALATVLGWRGYRYRWTQDSVIGHPGKYDYGVLSPDVQSNAPELVVDSVWDAPEGDKYKTVNYVKMAPFFIESFREQQAQIEELKAQIKLLQQAAE